MLLLARVWGVSGHVKEPYGVKKCNGVFVRSSPNSEDFCYSGHVRIHFDLTFLNVSSCGRSHVNNFLF